MVIAYNVDFKLPERRSRDDKPESIKDDFEAIISPDYKSEQIELNPRFNERNEDTPLSHATVAKQKEVVIDKELTLTAERNSVVVEEEDTKLSPNLAVEEVVEEKKADANVLVEKFGQYDPQ